MGKYIIGNWKMNNSFADIPVFVKYLKKNAKKQDNLVVCVPSVMVSECAKQAKGVLAVGAQNCHNEAKGAYTGEVSAQMIKEAGATYVIIGHSERRHIFGESNEFIAKKVEAALAAGLKVIFCIGETLEEKPKFKSLIKSQVLEGLKLVNDAKNLIVAYEPVWAIGTGKVATTDDIVKAHSYIKGLLNNKFGVNVPVLYGGSVKSSNSAEILALEDVDGALIGGASLKAEELLKIAETRG